MPGVLPNREPDIKTHYLFPGTILVAREPYLVTTVLGSCVAVCIWHPKAGVGGINHYLLPLWNGEGLPTPKYGNIAIEKLIEKMESLGSKKSNMIAKVFGGGNIFESKLEQFQIGERNIAIAKQVLEEHRIKIVGSSTGGNLGRKIQYLTSTGEVRQKMIEKKSREAESVVKMLNKFQ